MVDFHTHSDFSSDSGATMESMVEKAISLGLQAVAVTDHYDPDFKNPDYEYIPDFKEYHKALLMTENKYRQDIRVVKGLEMGVQHGATLKKCRSAASSFPYDFILGAFHCAEGFDVSTSDFFKNRSVAGAYRAFYNYMLDNLREYKNYDVVAHFNIIDRYSPEIPGSSAYFDIVEKILALLVADGKGIEINTSSERYGMGGLCTPTPEILKLYVKLGGEIITTGSDAHRPADVGYAIGRAEDMVRGSGLNYISIFKDRKAEYIKI